LGERFLAKEGRLMGSLNHEICRSCQHERGKTGFTISIILTPFTMLVMKTFNAVPNTSQRNSCHSTKGGKSIANRTCGAHQGLLHPSVESNGFGWHIALNPFCMEF